MDDRLSERKKRILKAIVEAHIEFGEPVGSKFLTTDQQLTCSSATIRNEMAELEEMGYLEQPHTSAGRVPSELGYRFYVDTLLERYRMTKGEIEQTERALHRKLGELDQILADASRLASSLTNYTGIAFKPRAGHREILKFESAFVDEHHFVLIMVGTDGTVKTKNIHTAFRFTAMSLRQMTDLLNRYMAGVAPERVSLATVFEMEAEMGDAAPVVGPLLKTVYETMKEMDGGDVRVAGVDHLLQYPEYNDHERLRDMLGMLESKENLLSLLPAEGSGNDVGVYIGSESGLDVMSNSTFVYRTVQKNGKVVGAIGVIGPCRMDYSKVIGIINHLTENIDSVINSDDIENK